jgi:hypothetical protein
MNNMIPISVLISCKIGCDIRNSDIEKTPILGDPTSVYDPDIGFTCIRYRVYQISGIIRYRVYPISGFIRYQNIPPISGTFKNIPDIGYNIGIKGCRIL